MRTPKMLSQIPIFKGLDPADLQRITQAAESVKYSSGHTIVEIGDPGKSLFLIIDGDVQVIYPSRSSDFELARLGPGDFFGEMALLNDKPRSATVRARSEVTALKLEKEAFRQAVQDAPNVALKVLEVLSIRIRTADEQISDLSDQTQRDLLTGLLNRRAFRERMAEECERFRRYGLGFGTVVFDVDKFRDINDTFGQDAGDATLAWVARLLVEHSRAVDVPFRIGGEEFALICPSTLDDHPENVARRIVEVAEEAKPPVAFALKVTLSAGFASCPRNGRSPTRSTESRTKR